MDNREIVAYAVDADTDKVTWVKYNEPWKDSKARCMDDYYLQRALKDIGEI